jgi:transposase
LLLERILAHIDFLEGSLAHIQQEVEQRLSPYEEAMTLVQSRPGIQEVAAAAILSEIGVERERFPSAKHLASWAGLCPGKKQSGGKRLSGATRVGWTYLRAMLGEVAWIISRMKDNSLAAQ